MERRSQARAQTGAFVAIAIVAVVLLNILAVKVLHARIDLTKRGLYSLSEGTKRTLGRLTDNLTITIYWTPDQPAPANDDERLLREQLDEYVAASRGRLEVRWVRTDNDERKRQAEGASCTKRVLQTVNTASDQANLAEVFRCITFSYLRSTEQIAFVNPGVEGMEYQITSIVKKMIDPERAIGFLTGHDEGSPEQALPYLSRILQEAHLGYTTRTIDLHGGEEEIPADIKGLVIMGPSRRIEERELRRINSYLMRGGSVAVFAGGTTITGSDTRPTAARAEHNLNGLLEGYGVTINPDIVLDFQASDSVQEIEQGRARIPMFTYPALAARRDVGGPGIDTAHPAVFRLPGVILPFVSSLTINNGRARENGTVFTAIGRTSDRSVLQRERFELDAIELLQRRQQIFGNARASYVVGVALEGQLRSAFAANDTDHPPAHATREHPARLLVVGSGKVFHIDQLRAIAPLQNGMPTNVQMLLNVFDWLSQDPDLLAVRAKDVSEPSLQAVTDTRKQLFKWGSIIGLPLLVGVLGVVLMNLRARKRAEITL
ncbi:MAG: GldG family protein [Deltaproteobacteria bacterium]|nr:GldG family protein [Myxococcales bacterium]MDP3219444.1 GldG family protein [Deltaproteobacteria bacterium]